MNHSVRNPLRINDARRRAFMYGLRDALVPLVAVATWGFVTGIAMVKAGLTESMATLMTVMVYAGSAQLTALPLIESGAPLWLIFAAGFVVNIRFIIFGAALQPYFRHLSWPRRFLLGLWTSDIVFVIFMARYGDRKRVGTSQQLWYFLGVVIPGWLVWNIFSLFGVYMGSFVPSGWSLDFAAILALLAIVIPLIKTRPVIMCMVVAAVIAWLGQPLPLRLGLAAAVVAGVIAGVMAERTALRARGLR